MELSWNDYRENIYLVSESPSGLRRAIIVSSILFSDLDTDLFLTSCDKYAIRRPDRFYRDCNINYLFRFRFNSYRKVGN